MPLNEIDPNIASGRNSRASASNTSVGTKDAHHRSNSGRTDMFSNAGIVMGMLKTSTELGDIGSLPALTNRLPKRPHGPGRRPSNNTLSRTSSRYSRTGSIRSKASNRSMTEQSVPSMPGSWPNNQNFLSETQDWQHERRPQPRSASQQDNVRPLHRSNSDHLDPEQQRSLSLTASMPPRRTLSNQRSATSLRSYDTGPRTYSPMQYPVRLRRPGFRPISPAMSDNQSAIYQGQRTIRPPPGPRTWSNPPDQSSVQRNTALQDGTLRRPAMISNLSLEDFRGTLNAPSRPRDSMLPFEPRPGRWMNSQVPASLTPPTYTRPPQPFKSTPSPLKAEYTRFGPKKIEPPSISQDAPRSGFVQRVKNLLEERAVADGTAASSTPSPRKLDVETAATPWQSSSASKRMSGAAIGTIHQPHHSEMIDDPSAFDVATYAADLEQSVADGSSLPGRESMDVPHASSTPDTTATEDLAGPLAFSEASTKDSLAPAIEFSLRTTVQKATAPTISEASQSANDLLDSPDDNLPLLSDAFTLDRTADRPFSYPFASPAKTESTKTPSRQSLPAAALFYVSGPNPALSTVDNGERTGSQERQVNEVLAVDSSVKPLQQGVTYENTNQSQPLPDGQVIEICNGLSVHAVDEGNNTAEVIGDVDKETHPAFRTGAHSANASVIDVPAWIGTSVTARQTYAFGTVEPGNGPLPNLRKFNTRVSHASDGGLDMTGRRASIQDPSIRNSVASVAPRASTSSPHTSMEGNDVRNSTLRPFNFALPDLTEDSQEATSTTNLRMLGVGPHPFRASGPRGPRGNFNTRRRAAAAPEPPTSYLSHKLKDTKGIPSFTFSSTDLTTTLNRALGLRSSRSVEDIRNSRQKRESASARSTRVVASEDFDVSERERYRSFFQGDDAEAKEEVSPEVTDHSVPDELLAEIDRISIPSVNGLTLRLSELLPALHRLASNHDVTTSDQGLTTTIDEIREIGSEQRSASVEHKRLSLLTSELAMPVQRKDTITSENTDTNSRAASRMGVLFLNKDLPPLPTDIVSPRPSVGSGSPLSPLSGNAESIAPVALAELEGTVPLEFANHSSTGTVRELRQGSPEASNIHQSSTPQTGSTTTTRPWNHPSSYPWSGYSPGSDVGLVAKTRDTGSPVPHGLSKLQQSRSVISDENIRIARSMSPGPRLDADLIPQPRATTSLEGQVAVKKGPIGSLIRKMGIRPRIDKAGFPIDPAFLHPEERATEPGDRYPTTGLTPPAGLNIEDNRSFFSDDSSSGREPPHIGTIRKRLTRSRQKRSGSRAQSVNDSVTETRVLPNTTNHDGSVFGGSQLATTNTDVLLMMYDQPPTGMSKMEFHAKKMLEKLKTLWFRSGRKLKNLGHHKKQAPSWYEASEVYSGV